MSPLRSSFSFRNPRQSAGCRVVTYTCYLAVSSAHNSTNLGLFTRVYPRRGTSDEYSKFWTNGYSAVQKLAAAWVEAAEDTIGAETAAEWVAQLRADDSEFVAMSGSAVGARSAPAPPPVGQQYRSAEASGPNKRDRVDQQQTKRQTITLQQQLRQRVAERYAQTNSPQPGP